MLLSNRIKKAFMGAPEISLSQTADVLQQLLKECQ